MKLTSCAKSNKKKKLSKQKQTKLNERANTLRRGNTTTKERVEAVKIIHWLNRNLLTRYDTTTKE